VEIMLQPKLSIAFFIGSTHTLLKLEYSQVFSTACFARQKGRGQHAAIKREEEGCLKIYAVICHYVLVSGVVIERVTN
jgi:hypothetical protein